MLPCINIVLNLSNVYFKLANIKSWCKFRKIPISRIILFSSGLSFSFESTSKKFSLFTINLFKEAVSRFSFIFKKLIKILKISFISFVVLLLTFPFLQEVLSVFLHYIRSCPSGREEQEVSYIIGRIITNKASKKDGMFLEKLIVEFKELGCDLVILGCTDLSNIVKGSSFVVDSFSVLSEKIKNILLDNWFVFWSKFNILNR